MLEIPRDGPVLLEDLSLARGSFCQPHTSGCQLEKGRAGKPLYVNGVAVVQPMEIRGAERGLSVLAKSSEEHLWKIASNHDNCGLMPAA